MKKTLGLLFIILPIVAGAQSLISTNEKNLPLCPVVEGKCWDGISYAFLIEHSVAKEDYPRDATEFALLKDSLQ